MAGLPPPGELGVVVHGPAILSRSPGIVLGLRCVFAQPGGLLLPTVVRAAGVQAEAAQRRFSQRPGSGDTVSEPRLWAEIDGRSGTDLSLTGLDRLGDVLPLL